MTVSSIILCVNTEGAATKRLKLSRSFWLMLLAAIVGTACILVEKYIPILLLSGALSFIGNASGIFALSGLPILVKTGLSSTEPFFILLFGIIAGRFLHKDVKETSGKKDLIKKVLCYVILSVGLIMLNMKI
jgi:hypothetical protein